MNLPKQKAHYFILALKPGIDMEDVQTEDDYEIVGNGKDKQGFSTTTEAEFEASRLESEGHTTKLITVTPKMAN